MRNFTRTLLGGAAAIAIATGLVGCSNASEDPAADGLQIVTTTTQLTDFANNVTAGTDAQVTGLLQPNASAHSFEANAADLELIRTADVVIMNGIGLETWLPDILESAGFEGTTIDASSGIDASEILAGGDHDHGDESESGAEDEHDHGDETATDSAGAEHAHDVEAESHAGDEHDHADEAATDSEDAEHAHNEEAHDDHDHGDENPHIWTSPTLASEMTTEIATGLASVDEAHAETYETNAAAYVEKLDALDTWIAENIESVPEADRLLVTNHDALTYFNHDYGITFIGSVMPSWDDNAEPSAAEIDTLVAAIKDSGVQAVFTETQLSPGTAEAIAKEAGVKVYSGDQALYTDSLGAEGSGAETYISSTIHNTTQLMDSWGETATELPEQLQES
ncbi:metal ABC transporter substrate-binding protein [Gulosibacter chungangensis]|uniref:metal ABC transporter substrate-binding protein n=1 Tax=Gulosibacter chungangensis TaxID=979746 RepID=UPI001CE4071E|nr:metal ABC transporter substrate-binding protein [Gulosibacter chungangensis]